MTTAGTANESLTLAFRNVARYVRDPAANLPLYEALGFSLVRDAGDMLVLRHHDGVGLVLHRWDERPTTLLDTAMGFTISGDESRLRNHLERAGWRLLRAPQHGDVGYFLIYGDLDGNPVNLVGRPLSAATHAGTVRLVLRDGRAVAEAVEP